MKLIYKEDVVNLVGDVSAIEGLGERGRIRRHNQSAIDALEYCGQRRSVVKVEGAKLGALALEFCCLGKVANRSDHLRDAALRLRMMQDGTRMGRDAASFKSSSVVALPTLPVAPRTRTVVAA